jgi:c-di-AMP phosphodiesterase-like protein
MRNTKTGEALQGNSTPQTLQEFSKNIKDFKGYCNFQEAENQLQNLIIAWVGSDFIERQNKIERENTFTFFSDLQAIIKSIYMDNPCDLTDLLDRWDQKSIDKHIREITTSFVDSEAADCRETRMDGFYFLEMTEKLLKNIKASIN